MKELLEYLNQRYAQYQARRAREAYLEGMAHGLVLLITERFSPNELLESLNEKRNRPGWDQFDQGAQEALDWWKACQSPRPLSPEREVGW